MTHLIITNELKSDIKDDEIVLGPLYSHNVLNDGIDEYVANSECEQVTVENLNTIPLGLVGNTLNTYIKKMRKGGKITVFGTDIYMLSLQIVNRTLDMGQANHALFGGPTVNLLHSSLVGINDVVNHLIESGLRVVSKNLDGYKFKVEAERM